MDTSWKIYAADTDDETGTEIPWRAVDPSTKASLAIHANGSVWYMPPDGKQAFQIDGAALVLAAEEFQKVQGDNIKARIALLENELQQLQNRLLKHEAKT